MSDTVRSKADILTLFADNTSGNISPQDLRDFVVSLHSNYGCMYANGVTDTFTVTATPQMIDTFDTEGSSAGVSMSTANGTITLPVDGVYRISFTASVYSTNNKTFVLELYKNDIATNRTVRRLSSSATDIEVLSANCVNDFTASDVIDIRVYSTDGGTSLTVTDIFFNAQMIG